MKLISGFLICTLVGVVAAGTGRYCYTKWLDRDTPSHRADYEDLSNYDESVVCERPVGIECMTVDNKPYKSTGKYHRAH